MKIGLLGGGTVGGEVVRLLMDRRDELAALAGEPLDPYIVLVRNGDKPRASHLAGRLTTDPFAVVDDPEVAIVVEAVGGVEPARTWVLGALRNGKSLVTANKALMAEAGPAIFRAARAHRAVVRFEAAVAASVPVLAALREVLTGERIWAIAGILNGSTNFLLDAMDSGQPRDAALSRARREGYLEADPSDDVEGVDSARKLALLASVAWGEGVPPGASRVRGISDVEERDVHLAPLLGRRLRLLAWAERAETARGNEIALAVEPALLPMYHPLAHLAGPASAVSLFGHPGGETFLAGSGAGGGPTALAVVGDLVTTVRMLRAGGEAVPSPWDREIDPERLADRPGRYALRVEAPDGSPDVEALAPWGPATEGARVLDLAPAGDAAFWLLADAPVPDRIASLREAVLHVPGVRAVGPALRLWDPPDTGVLPLFEGHGQETPDPARRARTAGAGLSPAPPLKRSPGGDLS